MINNPCLCLIWSLRKERDGGEGLWAVDEGTEKAAAPQKHDGMGAGWSTTGSKEEVVAALGDWETSSKGLGRGKEVPTNGAIMVSPLATKA